MLSETMLEVPSPLHHCCHLRNKLIKYKTKTKVMFKLVEKLQ